MKTSGPSSAAFLALLAWLLATVGPGAAGAGEPDSSRYRSAAVCAECHPEIVRTWRSSQHASAFTDPAFQLPYDRIRRADPPKALACEYCHNPMRSVLPPHDPRASIFAQEGVTCDFCHSVESVSPQGPFPRYRTRPGIKFGPRGGSRGKTIHETRFSRLHITSELCAGCHEYWNKYGIPVLTTYSEWKESFYRGEGVHCQFCHLPQLFDARVIDPKTGKGPPDHAMLGGHSRERLAKAIPVKAQLTVGRKDARLVVQLRNETVGHKTPSGIPLHRVRLTSTIFDGKGNVLARKEEVFERVLGDGTGKAIEKPEMIFTASREVLKDNRIGPKETRRIVHVFPIRGAVPTIAEVALAYEMPTPDIAPAVRYIEIPISRTIIPAEPRIAPSLVALIASALAVAVALLAAAFLVRLGKRPDGPK
ncbi:MAG: cytochrome c family protein [Deltaproteobacteria bacterium]|nr:cytochrome c family protein [Deltaproteobacteria bacterium]